MRGYSDTVRSTTCAVHFVEAIKVDEEVFDIKTEMNNVGMRCAYIDCRPFARNLEVNGGNDFTPRAVYYGEFEIRKDAGGALKVTERRRQRSISFSSGLLGDRKELPSVTRTYPPARL